jgi:hypothetical protein
LLTKHFQESTQALKHVKAELQDQHS